MWRAAAGDPYPMEKNEDEILMFTRIAERGLSLPASNFFKGLMGYYDQSTSTSTPTVFSTLPSSYISAKLFWGSSPIGSCSGSSSG
jgi:hypothetical protein